jgi:hypothetical protein
MNMAINATCKIHVTKAKNAKIVENEKVVENIKSVAPEMYLEDKIAYSMTLTVSEADLNVLLSYVTAGEGATQDAHAVMVKIIDEVELDKKYRPETWQTRLYDMLVNHAVILLQLCIGFAL